MDNRKQIQRILEAMRADSIPAGEAGLWKVRKVRFREAMAKKTGIPEGRYTYLTRWTEKSMHQAGECVMNDTPGELRKHLEFVLRAHGRVLVTGLGLGCVVRGLLERPAVEQVDVVEREADVLRLVEEHAWPWPPRVRVRLHHAEALAWIRGRRDRWDCAWHDLWSDPDRGEPNLAVTHMELFVTLRRRCGLQGAWAFPRRYREALRRQRMAVV